MTPVHRLASIVRWIMKRRRAEQDLDVELRTYVEMSADARIRGGQSPDDARRLALAEIGGLETAKERVRSGRHGWLLDEIGRDLRHAIRLSLQRPGFTAVILVTLALGIGANTAIFTLIDALMLRPLAVRQPDELALVSLRDRTTPTAGGEALSYAIVRALDDQRTIFASVGGFSGVRLDTGAPGSLERVSAEFVTGGFYDTLGLQPAAGRLLARDDDEKGAPIVAVLGERYWRRAFGGKAAAVGQSIPINGLPVTIVGVAPRGFDGADIGQMIDLTLPASALPAVRPAMAEMVNPGNFWLRVLARPAAGLTTAEAAAGMNVVWPSIADGVIASGWPAPRRRALKDSIFVLEPGATGWTYLRDLYDRPLVILQAVAGLVLLLACANVAGLFLARALTRRREMAVRLAIGAGWPRIVRQLLIEGLLVSLVGAALGVGVAALSSRLLIDLIDTGPFQVSFDLTPNGNVLLFSAALGLATGAVFGIVPVLQMRRHPTSLALKVDDRTSTGRAPLLPALVVVQVAISLVLVGGAGLLVRTLRNLDHVDRGFDADGVFVVSLERGKGPAPARLLDIVRRVPGVTAASVSTHTPLDGSSWGEAIVPAGHQMPENDNARIVGVGPDFLRTLRIPLVSGRDIGSADTTGALPVALINQRYAHAYFPTENPIGRHLMSDLMGQTADLEIVGVVHDTVASGLRRQPPPMVYVSLDQFGGQLSPSLAIRTRGGSESVAEAARAALQAELPMWPVELTPLASQVRATIIQERLVATLGTGFGALAIVLASVGLYGTLAYRVALRSREIGIRMALGATSGRVLGLVLRNGILLLVAGVLLGYPAAWAAGRAVSTLLFRVAPWDPLTMAAAIGILTVATCLASYLPARRAARVDPLLALRLE